MATGTGDTFAFDAMAADYDDGFTHTELGQRLRRAVHRRLDHHFQPGHRVLELNCGTGEDAVHLARRGVHVVATDRSPEMIRVTRAKARRAGVADRIQAQPLAIEDLDPGLHGAPSSEGGSSRARPPDPGFTPGATQFHPEGWETGVGGGFPPFSKGGPRGDFCLGSDLPSSSKGGTIQEERGDFHRPDHPDPGFTPGATQFHPEGWETGAGGGFPASSKGGTIQEERGDFRRPDHPDPGFTPGATQFHPEGWETGVGGGFPPSSKGGAIQEDRGDFRLGSDLPASSKGGTIQEDRGDFEPPFDGAFSNFGGLNCVGDLEAVARRLAPCLKPGAPLLLCIMGPSVPWEWAWYLLHREPKRAFRRWTRGGVAWRGITIRYPSIGAARRAFQPDFHARRVAGVGTFLPPTYAEPWAARHPRLLNFLERWERRLERCPPIPHLADHYLLELERR